MKNRILFPVLRFLFKFDWAIFLAGLLSGIGVLIWLATSYTFKPVTFHMMILFVIAFVVITPFVLKIMMYKRRLNVSGYLNDDEDNNMAKVFAVIIVILFFAGVGIMWLGVQISQENKRITTKPGSYQLYMLWNQKGDIWFSSKYPLFDWSVSVRKANLGRTVQCRGIEDIESYRHELLLDENFYLDSSRENAKRIFSLKGKFSQDKEFEQNAWRFAQQVLEAQRTDLQVCQYPKIDIAPIYSVPGNFFQYDFSNVSITGTFTKTMLTKTVALEN